MTIMCPEREEKKRSKLKRQCLQKRMRKGDAVDIRDREGGHLSSLAKE